MTASSYRIQGPLLLIPLIHPRLICKVLKRTAMAAEKGEQLLLLDSHVPKGYRVQGGPNVTTHKHFQGRDDSAVLEKVYVSVFIVS